MTDQLKCCYSECKMGADGKRAQATKLCGTCCSTGYCCDVCMNSDNALHQETCIRMQVADGLVVAVPKEGGDVEHMEEVAEAGIHK